MQNAFDHIRQFGNRFLDFSRSVLERIRAVSDHRSNRSDARFDHVEYCLRLSVRLRNPTQRSLRIERDLPQSVFLADVIEEKLRTDCARNKGRQVCDRAIATNFIEYALLSQFRANGA